MRRTGDVTMSNPHKQPAPHISSKARVCLSIALLACLTHPCGSSAEVIGDVVRVGYLTNTGSVVRLGSWTPVVVDLTLQNQASFDGKLVLKQTDRDGDIYRDVVPVHLFADGGDQRRYWLYTPASPSGLLRYQYQVELLATGENGREERQVKIVSGGKEVSHISPPTSVSMLPDDEYLILTLSNGPIGKIRHLVTGDMESSLDRPVQIAHISPESLPGKWIGLEMVDCIVWDQADPTVLTEAQEQALVEWIRQGGKLLLAAGRTSDVVSQATHLGPLLPVSIGPVEPVSHLPETRRRLLGIRDSQDEGYRNQLALAKCKAVSRSDVTNWLYEETIDSTVVAGRRLGRGYLLYVAAELEDLLRDPAANPVLFFRRILQLRPSRITGNPGHRSEIRLARYFDAEVGFCDTSGGYLALALIAVIAYVLGATFGVWKMLQARQLLKYSWSALAIVALAASFLAVVGVQAIHGVGRKVEQLTIVDGFSDTPDALATAYFGMTTSVRSHVDVWLPVDPLLSKEPANSSCILRPLADWSEDFVSEAIYTDPAVYELRPATAEIHDVVMRATLKQFEGRWHGTLSGTLKGKLGNR